MAGGNPLELGCAPARPLIARLRAEGLTVGDNEPYSGRGLHGYSQQTHIDGRGLAGALIEVRQDLIDTHRGAEAWGAVLARVLGELLKDPRLYRAAPSGAQSEAGASHAAH